MRFLKILLVSLTISLVLPGCQNLLPTQQTECTATKPVLQPTTHPDGSITLDKLDTAMLLFYIEDLERCSGLL